MCCMSTCMSVLEHTFVFKVWFTHIYLISACWTHMCSPTHRTRMHAARRIQLSVRILYFCWQKNVCLHASVRVSSLSEKAHHCCSRAIIRTMKMYDLNLRFLRFEQVNVSLKVQVNIVKVIISEFVAACFNLPLALAEGKYYEIGQSHARHACACLRDVVSS